MNDDLSMARRYISSIRQTRRMFRRLSEDPEGPKKKIEWDEEALDRELDELEAELEDERRD
jgi:glutathione S-transferase